MVSYAYDGTSGYDALSRPLLKSYLDGTPQVTYSYDSGCASNCIGHLLTVANSASTTQHSSFDAIGRPWASAQTTAGTTYEFVYQYDLAGNLVTETYPSGRVVTTGFDAADRPSSVSGTFGSTQTNYASQSGFFPNGTPSAYKLGNNLVLTYGLNTRLQTASTSAGSLLGLTFIGVSHPRIANNSRKTTAVYCPRR